MSGDLDEIVLAALRKEPQHRYATVDALAEDVRRHLDGLPVAARRGSWRYRCGRFVRRHRSAVGAAAVVVLSLLIAIAVSMRESRQANDALDRVVRVNTFLSDMLTTVDTNAALGPHGAVRTMLDEATLGIEAGALAGQPEVEASVRLTVGMTYR